MKKLLIIFTMFILLITNSICIFADDSENEDNDTEINENIDNEEKLNNDTEIKEIKNDINSIKSSLNNLESRATGRNGLKTNFDNLSENILEFYINNFNDIRMFYYVKQSDTTSFIFYLLNSESEYINVSTYTSTSYKVELTGYHRWTIGNQSSSFINNSMTLFIYLDIQATYDDTGWYRLLDNNLSPIYSLTPYSVNILNNGLNEYSITPSQYDLGYYPSGSTITINYDNSINDFFGYFDNQGNLLSSNTTYTFDITQDTNIVINYRAKDGIDYYPYMIYIILILTIIFLSTFIKGGLLS